jgi:hypothetical protein
MRVDLAGLAVLTLVGAAAIGTTIAAVGANKEQRVLEATVQMERLAAKLERAKKIAPETKLEIDRLIRQPWYDCNQMACTTALERRNRVARVRLQTVLAGSGVPTELSARTKAVRTP